MGSREDDMAYYRDQERIADIEARHESEHDERPNLDDCERCRDSFNDRAAQNRPSRAERQSCEYVAAIDGWVTSWEEAGA